MKPQAARAACGILRAVEQHVVIECWSCRIVHPGQAKCDVCAGRGTLRPAARMADAEGSHALMRDALERVKAAKGAGKRHEALVAALVAWQIYGVPYVGVEHRAPPDSDAFKREHGALRDRLADEIRRLERE